MTGSDPALVAAVVPIVAFLALAFWLGLVFYVGSHPFWRHHQQAANQPQRASSSQTGTLPPSAKPGLSGSAGGAPVVRRVAHR